MIRSKRESEARVLRRSAGRSFAAAALLLASGAGLSGLAWADLGDAKAVLKAMSDYVSSQQTIEFTFDSSIEVITPEL